MSDLEEEKDLRIHIGNVSPKLFENQTTLSTRLSKFGTVVKELELFTKPLQDHYFGYITLKITPSSYDKLKAAFNGVLFMGMKLTVAIAKVSFQDRLAKDLTRNDEKKSERLKRAKIKESRDKRISEAETMYPVNSITGALLTTSGTITAPNQSAQGYSISAHTYNDISGNTKNKAPSKSLVGTQSYGAWTSSRSYPYTQENSHTAGGSELIPGRHRVTKRKNHTFSQTLRILVNGELKTFKCYKTKLWGLEKNKTVKDLTWKYANGVWKSGDDHIVERVRKVKINDNYLGGPSAVECGINGDGAAAYGGNSIRDVDDNEDMSEQEDLTKEAMKNKSVLASLFDKFDFDRPMEVEEDTHGIDKEDIVVDKKGRRKVIRYDYEIEGGLEDHDESDNSEDKVDISKADAIITSYTSNIERPQEEVYYDEDDEGNELDLDGLGKQYSTEAIVEKYNEEHAFEIVKSDFKEPESGVVEFDDDPEEVVEKPSEPADEESSEDEFVPTFGQSSVSSTNNTEVLRSLFNPGNTEEVIETGSGFKLALDENDDDIDEDRAMDEDQQQALLEQIRNKQEEDAVRERSTKFGLFWPHLDSPFLSTQSQISKIGAIGDHIKLPGEKDEVVVATKEGEESPYEKWFWENRGELSRECKRRRRDVLRVFKKKSNKFPAV
ncbi:putaative nucleolar protein required for 60S ribosome biogenesis [Scheffersomyces stipitis CBS 6054]|uniref:Putaative nucleolar protein required for 60S ribosome biogenesis n=1 Tax=Scheffersomyces stipitis (strain ATCC 58785 / CBS 6054 / NBRC 10063 / NRRL Y-11545) TaxID=322104 RepID=A3LTB8_PICST|nr:putaative nucleolar protein required for 60S ribosome biogenesis [Scheffersomyces stipitis CBS 6054]ABN66378.2 putaative nucleolar protein required for 60S ribosome biogenesis [Scheffersomyces stipitis CBS 6054]